MQNFREPLPHSPRRVVIAGVTGVGKSTLARRLADLWSIPYSEMDTLHWGPGWTTRANFADDVARLARQDCWITEWQYWSRGIKHTIGDRADTCIWLNFPRPIALQRLLRRTIKRNLFQCEPFDGCVEPPLWSVLSNRDHILRFEAKTHNAWRERMPGVREEFPELTVVELTSPGQVRRWLAGPAASVPLPHSENPF